MIHFRHHVAESLLMAEQVATRKIGRPSKSPSPSNSPLQSPSSSRERTPVRQGTPIQEMNPINDVRYDQVGHWPAIGVVQRCKYTGCNQRTVYFCTKCGTHLCIVRDRNYFMKYHNK